MHTSQYIYSFTYDDTESDLCKLESRNIFDTEERDRVLFSNMQIKPSSSAFIKSRIDIIASSNDYSSLLNGIKNERISIDDFKVEYKVLKGDDTGYKERLKKQRDIGIIIEGVSEYYNPTTTFTLCKYQDFWYFGTLNRDKVEWQKHNDKPHSYSNSIGINIGKSLVNIAAMADRSKTLIDACSGVGTIMLEACFAGYTIEGCEINWRICRNARANISHFGYDAFVHRIDIKHMKKRFDAAIIDLPYNLVSFASESDVLHIIKSVSLITDRMVIVSTADITDPIKEVGFNIMDTCSIRKKGKGKFTRKIWVCEKVIL